MPDRRFDGNLKGKVPDEHADALAAVIAAAIEGAKDGAIGATFSQELFHIRDLPSAVGAPAITPGSAQGYDIELTPPSYTPEEEIEYTLKYSDDSLSTFTDIGYAISPATPVTFPNGYNSGRQFVIFADDVPGTPTTALA
jgi:hypothetical protein